MRNLDGLPTHPLSSGWIDKIWGYYKRPLSFRYGTEGQESDCTGMLNTKSRYRLISVVIPVDACNNYEGLLTERLLFCTGKTTFP